MRLLKYFFLIALTVTVQTATAEPSQYDQKWVNRLYTGYISFDNQSRIRVALTRNESISDKRDTRPEEALFFSDRDCSVYDKENWMCVTIGSNVIKMVAGNLMHNFPSGDYKRIK